MRYITQQSIDIVITTNEGVEHETFTCMENAKIWYNKIMEDISDLDFTT